MATDEKKQDKADYPNYIGKTNDIKKELENLRKNDSLYKSKFVDLYKRDYEYVADFNHKDKNIATVNIMQFNMLADGLSGIHVNENSKDDASKNKTFINTPKECLDFNYRGFRILEEITREASEPDIICLQECDQFEFLDHYLSPLGYTGEFNAKSSSPCVKIAKANNISLKPDGVAIFYSKDKFKIKDIKRFGKTVENIEDVDIPAIKILFTDLKTNKDFIVIVGHLKSTKNIDGECIRLGQLQHLLPNIKPTNTKIPIFFACDLNTNNNENYSTVYNSIMFPAKIDDNDKNKPLLPKEYISGYNNLGLVSSYYKAKIPDCAESQENMEPVFTTYKKRKGGEFKHCIDYIFYQPKNAKCVRLLSIPESKDINQETLLPGWEYPSDHMAIQACFQF